jgi:hypothetical protein
MTPQLHILNLPLVFQPLNHVVPLKHHQYIIDLYSLLGKNTPLVQHLLSLGMEIVNARFLQTDPFRYYAPHIDYWRQEDFQNTVSQQHIDDLSAVKINFVYNSWGTTMSWYSLVDAQHVFMHRNAMGQHVRIFGSRSCEKTMTLAADHHCLLVNAGNIHSLRLGQNQRQLRQCWSLILTRLDHQPLTWAWVEQQFAPWLKAAEEVDLTH